MALLETRDLTKQFGELSAVDEVNYALEEGELASIIGPNGAGKTTFFNLLIGEYEATYGNIVFQGEDITDTKPHQRVEKGLGRVFQITNIFPDLTTFENVRLATQGLEVKSVSGLLSPADDNEALRSQAESILGRIGLLENKDMPAKNLAHGDKRRLEIGMALALEPEILLMDEPTAGLPDTEIHEVTQLISEIAKEYSIILVEHKMDLVMDLSDRISVLHRGELIADGTVEEIQSNQRVQEVYMGKEETHA